MGNRADQIVERFQRDTSGKSSVGFADAGAPGRVQLGSRGSQVGVVEAVREQIHAADYKSCARFCIAF